MNDVECTHCNDTGFVTVRKTFPMSYVCAGSPPDYAKGVVEVPCNRCNPVGRWQEETEYECETCQDDPDVCATIPGLRHCQKATDEISQS